MYIFMNYIISNFEMKFKNNKDMGLNKRQQKLQGVFLQITAL